VLDLGSSVWKAGFSGEGSPRECRGVVQMLAKEEGGGAAAALWGLEKSDVADEEWEVREERLKRGLRDVWFKWVAALSLCPPLLNVSFAAISWPTRNRARSSSSRTHCYLIV
jgi:hypothetical protein